MQIHKKLSSKAKSLHGGSKTKSKNTKNARKSPSESATSMSEGTIRRGNDGQLWVIKFFFSLALEHRLTNKNRKNPNQPFTNIFSGNCNSFNFDIVSFHKVANCLTHTIFQTIFMRTT